MAMTAKQLSDALRAFDDDTEVIVAVGPFEWAAIEELYGPAVQGEDQPDRCQRAICLAAGERF